jgi:divalent metal cation (Fe/Co/Zn/Cd) transporter
LASNLLVKPRLAMVRVSVAIRLLVHSGSIVIGAMLGMCAMFLIKRNMDALVGKSISPTRLRQIVNHLDTVCVWRVAGALKGRST